jgi:nicotinamidase/pyrazinamidase
MMSEKKVFIDIDTQHDFVDSGGRMPVPGAENIVAIWKDLTRYAVKKGIKIISTASKFEKDDPQFAEKPHYCLKDTPGQKKIEETLAEKHAYLDIDMEDVNCEDLLEKNDQIIINKKIDIFSNPHMLPLLELVDADDYVIYGLATDYCVKEAVMKIKSMKKNVTIILDAVESMAPETCEPAIQAMAEAGVHLLEAVEVLE